MCLFSSGSSSSQTPSKKQPSGPRPISPTSNPNYFNTPNQKSRTASAASRPGPRDPRKFIPHQPPSAPATARPSRFADQTSYEHAVRARKPDYAYRDLVEQRTQMASMPGYHGDKGGIREQARRADPSKRVTMYAVEGMSAMPGYYGR
ncbi:MAG: hypothetical protein Q9165_007656 [Trypethelium subeluteriae]